MFTVTSLQALVYSLSPAYRCLSVHCQQPTGACLFTHQPTGACLLFTVNSLQVLVCCSLSPAYRCLSVIHCHQPTTACLLFTITSLQMLVCSLSPAYRCLSVYLTNVLILVTLVHSCSHLPPKVPFYTTFSVRCRVQDV